MLTIVIARQCERESSKFPLEVRHDFLNALALIRNGQTLSMPLSRPMPSIGRNVHELRFRCRDGIFRYFYFVKSGDKVYVLYAFQKKTQKTPKKVIDIVKKRLRSLYEI